MRHVRRMRRGLGGTAVAAVAMAALTASQAPGFVHHQVPHPKGPLPVGETTAQVDGPTDNSYHTEIPPLITPPPPGNPVDAAGAGAVQQQSGIPATVLAAYRSAEARLHRSDPGCHLPWELLAAIGKVESGQARGGAVDAHGTTLSPILGPVLNGAGFAHIPDTDHGAYDGDTRYDRAVGPMQFIPSTWATWGQDGNGDGKKDPNNVFDAALAAGRYLCAGGRDLATGAGLDSAVLSYNHSDAYLRLVRSWLSFYRNGTHEVPDGEGVLPTSPGAGSESDPGGKPGKGGPDKNGHGKGGGGIVIGPAPSHSASPSPSGGASGGGTPTGGTTPTPSGSPSDEPGGPPTSDPSSGPPSDSPSPDPSSTPPDCPTPSGSASPSADPSPSGSPGDGCVPLPGEGDTPVEGATAP
ncbi:lytic transglycosylase domain-containing protein [Streptomyces sp. NBC_01387]|uniref:lytic transglycosylase domain-containing protein n=1 Tax=unclassified Streptomyces TaxID=2593676 RepID=UPI002023DA4C|nr:MULTISPECIES: lytic transglycosylase domain-containing protein [unclassified Streptomyces]WSC18727.1 lytic transglycosylase domain-containing protein [Streptomyces sp. NBC_01766]WSV52761.1 lytic transglycosylase domain-containing protein [Streptomyces sp. NBC_01014]